MSANLLLRAVGGPFGRREVVALDKALAAYSQADPRVGLGVETFLSAYAFPTEIRTHMAAREGSCAGYRGPVGLVGGLHFDVDRDDPTAALADARILADHLAARYGEGFVEVFFSGGKGYHAVVEVPAGSILPSPSVPATAKFLASTLAAAAGVEIDLTVYDTVRLWRAVNTRHPRRGRYKVQISLEELRALGVEEAAALAAAPRPYPYQPPTEVPVGFLADWATAAAEVAKLPERRPTKGFEGGGLNAVTRNFFENPLGVPVGRQAVDLFSAAADMVEKSYEDVDTLVALVLYPIAVAIGLDPQRARSQIKSGIAHGRGE